MVLLVAMVARKLRLVYSGITSVRRMISPESCVDDVPETEFDRDLTTHNPAGGVIHAFRVIKDLGKDDLCSMKETAIDDNGHDLHVLIDCVWPYCRLHGFCIHPWPGTVRLERPMEAPACVAKRQTHK